MEQDHYLTHLLSCAFCDAAIAKSIVAASFMLAYAKSSLILISAHPTFTHHCSLQQLRLHQPWSGSNSYIESHKKYSKHGIIRIRFRRSLGEDARRLFPRLVSSSFSPLGFIALLLPPPHTQLYRKKKGRMQEHKLHTQYPYSHNKGPSHQISRGLLIYG